MKSLIKFFANKHKYLVEVIVASIEHYIGFHTVKRTVISVKFFMCKSSPLVLALSFIEKLYERGLFDIKKCNYILSTIIVNNKNIKDSPKKFIYHYLIYHLLFIIYHLP